MPVVKGAAEDDGFLISYLHNEETSVSEFVVFDAADYAYARGAAARFPKLAVYLQPGNHTPPGPEDDDALIDTDGILQRMGWLVDRVIADRWFAAHVLPQLHVLLWGNKRGV